MNRYSVAKLSITAHQEAPVQDIKEAWFFIALFIQPTCLKAQYEA